MTFLYFRKNKTSSENIIKFGKTSSLYNRDCQYATGEYERGDYISAIKITNCRDDSHLLSIADDIIVLSPMLTQGPILADSSILQFFPIMQ